jgi:hypothetical protein
VVSENWAFTEAPIHTIRNNKIPLRILRMIDWLSEGGGKEGENYESQVNGS